MNFIIIILAGALIGWLASLIMKTDMQQGALANIVVGIIGSLIGVWVFGDMLGLGGAFSAGEFSVIGIFWGVIGAVVLIAILKALNVFK